MTEYMTIPGQVDALEILLNPLLTEEPIGDAARAQLKYIERKAKAWDKLVDGMFECGAVRFGINSRGELIGCQTSLTCEDTPFISPEEAIEAQEANDG